MMRILLMFLICVASIIGCKQSKRVISKSKGSVIENGWEKIPNKTNDYFLHVEVVEENISTPAVKRSFYISNANGDKVFEESIYGGYVKWLDDYVIEYFSTPGTIPSNSSKEDFVMIHDIKSMKTNIKGGGNN